jgi:EAL domain-containing protein (putative c-di-GMP-specific phosphodiesterase class I)
LHYQPRIDLRSGRLTGTEALIRWQSPRAGTIPPSYFLPDITSAEGVRKMLTFVLNTALADAKEWSTRIPNFTLSINLAAKNLADPDLYRVIETALEKWDFPGDQLILEARSEFIIENEESVIVSFSKLRNLGIRIAIDDFGSSGLSVTSLKTLPIDMLKIDKSFVVPMPSNETDRRIVGAIVQLAHAVNLEVIAEGIEDADIMQALLAVGCEAGEGFHFSRPIPAAEFGSAWVEKFSNKRVSAV